MLSYAWSSFSWTAAAISRAPYFVVECRDAIDAGGTRRRAGREALHRSLHRAALPCAPPAASAAGASASASAAARDEPNPIRIPAVRAVGASPSDCVRAVLREGWLMCSGLGGDVERGLRDCRAWNDTRHQWDSF